MTMKQTATDMKSARLEKNMVTGKQMAIISLQTNRKGNDCFIDIGKTDQLFCVCVCVCVCV
jgi:hypothetical protein